MENKILKRDAEQTFYTIEEVRAALAFEEFMDQLGYTYNPHGDCDTCASQFLCDCVCPIITLIDERYHNAPFYCALAAEMRTGGTIGHYESKFKKTTDWGAVQSSDGTDRIPVDPLGDVL